MARWHDGGDAGRAGRQGDPRPDVGPGLGRRPRRLAVALRYDPHRDAAPRVVAEGGGPVAERILAAAMEHGVPIREDPPLVEALAGLDVGDSIPPELYMVVAEIFVWLWRVDTGPRGHEHAERGA